MTTLREAAQQALNALGCLEYSSCGITDGPSEDTTEAAITALKAALAEPVQEPVAYSVARTLHWHEGKGVNDAQLYLAPPQRKPLTEEEIDSIWDSEKAFADIYAIARAVERAQGIV